MQFAPFFLFGLGEFPFSCYKYISIIVEENAEKSKICLELLPILRFQGIIHSSN